MSTIRWALMFALAFCSKGAYALQDYMEPGDSDLRCFRVGTVAGYGFSPKCEESVSRRGQIAHMRYNSQGLRDREFSPRPRAGWERILFTGPSLLTAPGLPETSSPPRIMERLMRPHWPRLEIINGGVEGYASIHTAAMMPSWQEAYRPTLTLQLVPLGIYERDLLSWPFLEQSSSGQWKIPFTELPRHFQWLKSLGLSDNQVSKSLRSWLAYGYHAARSIQCKAGEYIGIDSTICIFSATLKGALRAKQMAEKSGSRYLLVYLYSSGSEQYKTFFVGPFFDRFVAAALNSLTPNIEIKQASIEKWLIENKVPHILISLPSSSRYTLPRDYHFNRDGAELFAKEMARAIAPHLIPAAKKPER